MIEYEKEGKKITIGPYLSLLIAGVILGVMIGVLVVLNANEIIPLITEARKN